MHSKKPEDITFQITVGQLVLLSPIPKQDIHVTVHVDNDSKITCAGSLSEDGLTVIWNHPFLFSAPPSVTVVVTICILPKELTPEWEKQQFGDQMVTNAASLLASNSGWKSDVPGLSASSATLSMTCIASDVLIAPNGHDCLLSLEKYSRRLFKFGAQLKNVAGGSTNIEVNLSMLDLCPLGHPDHINVIKSLAPAFLHHYYQGGNIADLNRATEFAKALLDLCPSGHLWHAEALGNLVINLSTQYCIQRSSQDLNKIMAMAEQWLELCPPDHSDHGRALAGLALPLEERYNIQRDMADLDKAIEMRERSLDWFPITDYNYQGVLGQLAASILEHYQRHGNITDLNRCIDLQEKHLELCPPTHRSHGRALQNLAISLQNRYKKKNEHSDLIRAIQLFQEGLDFHPVQHPDFACTVGHLANTILQSPTNSQLPTLPTSLDEAFQAYRQLMACSPAVSADLLEAAQNWVNDAEKHKHSSVLEAYQTLLNTLDHFTSLNPSLDSRHVIMQARVADIANNAFSCAVRHRDFQMAVELLEQGRGILWNQLARFDISIVALESGGNQELARKFTQLSGDLRKHAQRTLEGNMDPYWRAQEEWQSVVDKIRCLEGFSRFLLPPNFDDLQKVAEHGPVIIVNASEYTCDTLIILYDHPPVHIDLSCSLADVGQLCSQLSELTRDAHAYGRHREFYVKKVLRDLWSSVVKPVVSVLQNDIQLPMGSRIWWCPTSKFTSLPFHAAGPHRKTEKNLMEIYVSSYAPSLSALLRARDRLQRSKKRALNASGVADGISFAAVGQARPSADIQLGELPEVEHELRRIRNETGMSSGAKFETVTGAEATIEGAVRAFRNHRWVHVACHGAQHPEKPFDSWFAMGDGKLTLMRIIQERYTNSEFAFLSACHTAVGDASTPDEVLHLAAGMQFAGFNGVIGTLWRVDDAVAHQMVTRFYREMFRQPVLDFEYAATALNTAALETVDEVSLEKRIVFVHIGI